MQKEKIFTPSNLLLALVAMCFLLSFSVVFTLNFRPLYYFDIDHLDIPAMAAMDEGEIRANYDELIRYNSIFTREPLEFPTLAMSDNGRIHFEEVKNIFVAVQVLLGLSFFSLAIGGYKKLKQQKIQFLKIAAVISVAIPFLIGALIALNWQSFFIIFHEIFFDNDYWIFDAFTDPVITILPDTFFMHCAIMILSLVLLGSGIFYFAYRLLKNKKLRLANSAQTALPSEQKPDITSP